MKNKCLLLLLCTMSPLALHAAANGSEQPMPTCITMQTPFAKIEVPIKTIEPVTGETFAQRLQKTIGVGLPLILTHIFYQDSSGVRQETLDICAAIRTHKTWDDSILTPDTTIIDCTQIEATIKETLNKQSPHAIIYSTHAIGPSYRKMPSIGYAVTYDAPDKKRLALKNATLTRLALLYDCTKDTRVLTLLNDIYQTIELTSFNPEV